jgi:hypothetical protein
MATSYFKELFTRDPSLNVVALVDLIQEKVTPEMNMDLCKDFTDEEIGDALLRRLGWMAFRRGSTKEIGEK